MVDIFFCGFVDFADGFFGSWVDGLEGLSILAFDELVVDETAINHWGQHSRSGTFGGGGKISSDKVRGKSRGQGRICRCHQGFEVKKLMMGERLTVQWVARICLLQAFPESPKPTC